MGTRATRQNLLSASPRFGLVPEEASGLIDRMAEIVRRHWRPDVFGALHRNSRWTAEVGTCRERCGNGYPSLWTRPHGMSLLSEAPGRRHGMTTKSRTVAVLLVACVGFSHAQPLQRLARVELNGEPLLQALMVSPAAGWPVGEPYVSLRDLRLAIDGREGPERSRLREDGRQLMAVATGGCDGCRLRVARTVLVSGALRSVGGEPHVPLSDIVRALEGRLDVDRAGPIYRIHAGICHWCVLEVAGRSPPRGDNSQGHAPTSVTTPAGLGSQNKASSWRSRYPARRSSAHDH
jgi:hypothetical protein